MNIFHALGKFLYNKRWDNKLKEGRQMTFKEQTRKELKSRPRFYANHAEILRQTLLEDSVLSLYLHENMLNFYGDVQDCANLFEVYSHLDGCLSRVEYQYGNSQYIMEI
jgi:hypothetical protein